MSYSSKPGGAQPGNNPGAPNNGGTNMPIGQHLQQKPGNNPINQALYMQQQQQHQQQQQQQQSAAQSTVRQLAETAMLSPDMFRQYQNQQMQLFLQQQQFLQFQQQQQQQQQPSSHNPTGGEQMPARNPSANSNDTILSRTNQLHQLQQLQQQANGGAQNANSLSLLNMLARMQSANAVSTGVAATANNPATQHNQSAQQSQSHSTTQKSNVNNSKNVGPPASIAAPAVQQHPPSLIQPTPPSSAATHHQNNFNTVNLDQKAKAKIALDMLMSSQKNNEPGPQIAILTATIPPVQKSAPAVEPKPNQSKSSNATIKANQPQSAAPPSTVVATEPNQTVPPASKATAAPTTFPPITPPITAPPKGAPTPTTPNTLPPKSNTASLSIDTNTSTTTTALSLAVPASLSPKISSPRTKQTPRKSNNPIKAATPSKVDEASSGSVDVPPTEVSSSSDLKEPAKSSVTPPNVSADSNQAVAKNAAASNPEPPHVTEPLKPEGSPSKPDGSPAKPDAAPQHPVTPTEDLSKSAAPTKKPSVSPVAKPLSAKVTSTKEPPAKMAKPVITKEKTSPAVAEVVAPVTTNKPAQKSEGNPIDKPADKPKVTTTTPTTTPIPTVIEKAKSTEIKPSTPAVVVTPKAAKKSESEGSSAKRHRAKTILYQSPTPELALVTKLSVVEANAANSAGKNVEDRLVLFYKGEFLAVRNAESGFFLCQTLHNVYKSSPRIRIRWLSELADTPGVYEVDFYDHTDLECVLTSLDLERAQKNNYQLVATERERIESILRRAIDVESGVLPRPDVTAENPDGLDLSLYTSESQIDKKSAKKPAEKSTPSATKRKASNAIVGSAGPSPKISKNTKRGRPSKGKKPSSVGQTPKPANGEAQSEDTEGEDQDYSPVQKKKKTPASSKKTISSSKKKTAGRSTKSTTEKASASPLTSRTGSRTTPRRTVAIVRSVIDAIQDEENRKSAVSSDSDSDNVALVPKGSAPQKQSAGKKDKDLDESVGQVKAKPTTNISKTQSPTSSSTGRVTRKRH